MNGLLKEEAIIFQYISDKNRNETKSETIKTERRAEEDSQISTLLRHAKKLAARGQAQVLKISVPTFWFEDEGTGSFITEIQRD